MGQELNRQRRCQEAIRMAKAERRLPRFYFAHRSDLKDGFTYSVKPPLQLAAAQLPHPLTRPTHSGTIHVMIPLQALPPNG